MILDNMKKLLLCINKLSINTAPVYSWIFIMISCVLSRTFLDLNKLNGIASKNKWVQVIGFKIPTRRSDHCDGCKVKIVFASHNIVNMNGYRRRSSR
jgi:hypothetical protein